MKTYYKTILNICAFILILLPCGCSDDDIMRNDNGSTLQETESYLISTFSLPEGKNPLPETIEQIFFQLKSLSDNKTQTFDGKFMKKGGIFTCDMYIPKNIDLENGDYVLWLKLTEEGEVYPLSYLLTFRDKMVSEVRDTKYIYGQLKGEGTEENPYLISSTNDFAYFVSQLATYDKNHGYGQYFKQIADIKAPIPNCLYQGNAYKSAPFAGNYDGSSYQILDLTYVGSKEQPSDFTGLFSKLHDGAVIRNLNIQGADIEYSGICCGLLAGAAYGNIRIENVSLKGSIKSANDKVGGLIGYVEGSDLLKANLDIRNVKLSVSFSENDIDFLGGLIGWAENANIKVDNIFSDGVFKTLKGKNNIGGLIGKLYGQIDASHIKLQHTMESGYAIYGNDNVGGLIGECFLQAASSFEDITIDMPIQGNTNVGGLIGQIRTENPENILISIKEFNLGSPKNSSRITAVSHAGGIIGYSYKTGPKAFTLEFNGESNVNASISGTNFIGGALGLLNDTHIHFSQKCKLYLDNSTVQASNGSCGGFAGALSYQEQGEEIILDPNILVINSKLHIYGNNNIGGLVGFLSNGALTGTYLPEFNTESVITENDIHEIFSGNINDKQPYRETASSVGGVVGHATNSTIQKLFTKPTIYGIKTVGGIVGYADNTNISDCGVKTQMLNNGNENSTYIGGIVGIANCTQSCNFSNLVNYSNISIGSDIIGGIFGGISTSSMDININKVVNLGDITATSSTGGIVGRTSGKNIQIYDAANFGTIKGLSGGDESGIGGIIGYGVNTVTIYKSVNHGDISVNKNAKYNGAGGILGYVKQGGAHIRYCCNRANLSYAKDKENSHGIGGIVGSIEKANDSDDSYVLDCYNTGNVDGQQKATGTLGTDYRGGIVGHLGSHGRCYRAVNSGIVKYGNGGVGYGNKNNLTHIYILYGTGKTFGATYIPQPIKEDKSIYQGFDFTGDHDPDRQPVWVMGGTYSSENNMLPYLHSGKCYFQFAKYGIH